MTTSRSRPIAWQGGAGRTKPMALSLQAAKAEPEPGEEFDTTEGEG